MYEATVDYIFARYSCSFSGVENQSNFVESLDNRMPAVFLFLNLQSLQHTLLSKVYSIYFVDGILAKSTYRLYRQLPKGPARVIYIDTSF